MASCCLQEVQRSRQRDGETGKHVAIVIRWSDISLERWRSRMYLELSLEEKKNQSKFDVNNTSCLLREYIQPPPCDYYLLRRIKG